ncbi:hypothetical protein DI09_222p20 [Mitosporidium daphniae]|uniref:Uncharacterized protein n=1 Tax=Mitosporidium daphniae TaxID=1485682 RepID=A0A098VSQ3_9MICR|nr:uncharacterized protein DI09_222p20 [Mitosporidium daphniae]KGG52022.1 hypothetical protein DI09_222p20 [Mitosporidium daphniae]|eukprot:XP_013238458.1 uncharacterized protein DI09_222p20 [Mitosporidium daphniae]
MLPLAFTDRYPIDYQNIQLNSLRPRILSADIRGAIDTLFQQNIAFPESLQYNASDVNSPELTSLRHSLADHESIKYLSSLFERVDTTLARQGILNEVVDVIRAQCFSDVKKEASASCILLTILLKNVDIFYPSNREISHSRSDLLSSIVKLIFSPHSSVDELWVKANNLKIIAKSISKADEYILS